MEFTGGEIGDEKVDNIFVVVGDDGFVKATVYFEKSEDSEIFNAYDRIKGLYVEKYGDPKSHFEFFMDPYYKGDGYEAQAVRVGKATFASFWEFPDKDGKSNDNLEVDISKYMEVSASYENGPMMETYLAKKKAKSSKDL